MQLKETQLVEKRYTATIAAAARTGYDATGVLSSKAPDRVDDTMSDDIYKPFIGKRIPALFAHDHEKIVGTWENLREEGGKLIGDLKLAATRFGEYVKALIEANVPLMNSVGFRLKTGSPNKQGGMHFTSIDLFEASVCAVGMHPEAVMLAKSYDIKIDQTDKAIQQAGWSSPGKSALHPPSTNSVKGTKKMNLSDRIVAAQKRHSQLSDRAVSITAEMDSETADMDLLSAELKSVNADIEKTLDLVTELKKTESNIAKRAEPVVQAPAVATKLSQRKDPKSSSDLFVKMAIGTLVAKRDGMPFDRAIEQTYGDTGEYVKDCASVIRKTATGEPPLNTFTPAAAGNIISEATIQWIEALTVESSAAALGARGRAINFNGRSSAKVSSRNPTALTGLTEPAWVHEGRPIPIMGFGVGQQTVERGKLAAIIPFTMELLEANAVADLESELRTAMIEAAAVRIDATFFSAIAAVTRVHPAGILNGVTVAAGVAGGGIDAVSQDIQAMYNKMMAARVGARPVLVLNTQDRMSASFLRTALGDLAFRDELAAGTLMGIPVIASQTLAAKTAVMVDTAYLGFGLDAPMFKYSEEATLVAANADGTAPTMAGTAGAAPVAPQAAGSVNANAGIMVAPNTGAGAAPAYSLYQNYEAALRIVQFGGWASLATGSVQAANALSW